MPMDSIPASEAVVASAGKSLFASTRRLSPNISPSLVVVLFIYDAMFITLDREISCFWAAKWTGASVLFLANKWLSVANCVMELFDYAPIFSNEVSRYESFHT